MPSDRINFFLGLQIRTYRNLQDELLATVLGLNGVQNGGKLLAVELDCSRKSAVRFLDGIRVVVDGFGDAEKDFRVGVPREAGFSRVSDNVPSTTAPMT